MKGGSLYDVWCNWQDVGLTQLENEARKFSSDYDIYFGSSVVGSSSSTLERFLLYNYCVNKTYLNWYHFTIQFHPVDSRRQQ